MKTNVVFDITLRNPDELERELMFAEVMRLREIAAKQADLLRNIGDELEEIFHQEGSNKNDLTRLETYCAQIQKYLLGDYGNSWRNSP